MELHPRLILAIFQKDLRDAIRDTRVLMALVVPLGLGISYNFVYSDEQPTPSATVAIFAAAPTELSDVLRRTVGDAVDIELDPVGSAEEVRDRVGDEDADIGLIVGAGFDASVASGAAPPLTLVQPEAPSLGASYVGAALERALRTMAGQGAPARVQLDVVGAGDTTEQVIFDQLGLRRYFVLSSLVTLVAMIALLVVPIVLAEEIEKQTIDALVLIASYEDVIAGKALLGIVWTAVSAVLLVAVTGLWPADPLLLATAMGLLSVALVGFGLLLGGLFRNANQLNTWGGVILIPVVAPAFIVGLPAPRTLDLIVNLFPTAHGARLAINGLTGDAIFPHAWLSLLVIAAWGLLAYLLLARSLRRREA